MQRLKETGDGSKTLYDDRFDEHLHSINGAYNESMHIFVNAGFLSLEKKEVDILEIGFGTGLNAVLTCCEAQKVNRKVRYVGLEKYPPDLTLLKEFYAGFSDDIVSAARKITDIAWDKEEKINDSFILEKCKVDFIDSLPNRKFDIIYFDAFSPEKHPEAWTEDYIAKVTSLLNDGGIFLTYSAKGIVKQALRSAGLFVRRLQGPPGKRHIIRAEK
jgi:tRNA U34 5-methylaminomethyl-2-thiouridine-forming methyltransferase MnmC